MLTYSKPEHEWTFFEIDPVVVAIAKDTNNYSFVSTYQPDIILGDGRLSLSHENNSHYDVIVIDAYSAGSIPLHLMTIEAVQLYLDKITPDGYVVFHVSNRHLDLEHIVGNIAAELSLNSYVKSYETDTEAKFDGADDSTWVVVTTHNLAPDDLGEGWMQLEKNPRYPTWSDERSSLLSVIRWYR